MLTHWKKLENPDYLGAFAFSPGEKKTLTIRKVTRETITGAEGKREECTIVHWQEDVKPMIVNATNGKTITKVLCTPYIEQWLGNAIVLGVERVKAFGDVVDAVRVLNEKPRQPATPKTHCSDCGEIIAAAGGFSAEAIIRASVQRFGEACCAACASIRKAASKEVSPDAVDQ